MAFRRTSFRDLVMTNKRIKRIDEFLRTLSISQIRGIINDLNQKIQVNREIAKYRAVLLRNLRNNISLDNNFFLQKNLYKNFVLIPLEKAITDGYEFIWKGSWKATYYDELSIEVQNLILETLQTTLQNENAYNQYCQYLVEYITKYLSNNTSIKIQAYNNLSDGGTERAIATMKDVLANMIC